MRVKKVLTVLFMVTALVFGVSASPQAAIPPEGQMGLQVVESTIATLMSQLQNTLDKPENFEAVSGMEALIEAIQNGTADQTLLNQFTQAGVLFQEAQDNPEQVTPMNLSVAQAIVLLIDQLLQNQNLDSQIVVFLEELKKLAEGSVEGYHNPGAGDPEFDPLNGPSADGGRDPFGGPTSGSASTEPNCCSHKLLEMMWAADQGNSVTAHSGRIKVSLQDNAAADGAWTIRIRPFYYVDHFNQVTEPWPEYLKSDLRDDVQAALLSSDIRQKDAFFTENADAKAGRVMTDRHGQTTRVEQYVLRPNSNSVQVLGVTYRENGDHAGMSTIDWKTKFAASIDGVDLKSLPWHEYLTTKSGPLGVIRYIDNSSGRVVNEMSVRFTNPENEWLMENRYFWPIIALGTQTIHSEYLTIFRNWETSEVTDVESPGYQAILFKRGNLLSPLGDGNYYFTVDNGNGFTYQTRQQTAYSGTRERDIDVELFTTSGGAVNADDIWGALNANGANGAGPTIGAGDGLEITIDSAGNFFNNPIDVIYLPMMTHLEWR